MLFILLAWAIGVAPWLVPAWRRRVALLPALAAGVGIPVPVVLLLAAAFLFPVALAAAVTEATFPVLNVALHGYAACLLALLGLWSFRLVASRTLHPSSMSELDEARWPLLNGLGRAWHGALQAGLKEREAQAVIGPRLAALLDVAARLEREGAEAGLDPDESAFLAALRDDLLAAAEARDGRRGPGGRRRREARPLALPRPGHVVTPDRPRADAPVTPPAERAPPASGRRLRGLLARMAPRRPLPPLSPARADDIEALLEELEASTTPDLVALGREIRAALPEALASDRSFLRSTVLEPATRLSALIGRGVAAPAELAAVIGTARAAIVASVDRRRAADQAAAQLEAESILAVMQSRLAERA